MPDDSLLSKARSQFHTEIGNRILSIDAAGIPTNADKDSAPSVAVAKEFARRIGATRKRKRLAGQTAGTLFEEICLEYLESVWPTLQLLRPGTWILRRLPRSAQGTIVAFDQYSHLKELDDLIGETPVLASLIGTDYLVSPDIIIARQPEPDATINQFDRLVDDTTANSTPLRLSNASSPILHASISCKWTIRSDRSQNSRSEALNLIRNRKGNLPHIKIVTAEPQPGRIASVALGTGDVDCIYHIGLYELVDAVEAAGHEDSLEMLNTMIDGRRLRDISDLPLDLAI